VVFEWCGSRIAALKRELELTRDEVRVLREQLGLAQQLEGLRSDVEQARADVPKVPALVKDLEKGHARLQRELETTQKNLKAVNINQLLADRLLAQLDKRTETRASEMELKIEASVGFAMREVHPAAAATLRDFATDTLKAFKNEQVTFVTAGRA
jgi:chromosome segregation ATPase